MAMDDSSNRFQFSTDAQVVNRFVEEFAEQHSHVFTKEDTEFSYSCEIGPWPGKRGLYSWMFILSVKVRDAPPTGVPNILDSPVAELILLQEQPGQCVGDLQIQSDPRQWGPDGPWHSVMMQAGGAFIRDIWRGLVQSWMASNAKGSPTSNEANVVATEASKSGGTKVGRPRLPENEWAYDQVHGLGRDQTEVFREWQGMKGANAGTLADPLDSFKKAIQPKKTGKK